MPDGEPRRLLLATPGFEAALIDELPPAWRARAEAASPGLVMADEPAMPEVPPRDPVFSRQQLPAAFPIDGASVAALAERCYALAEAAVDRAGGPFTLHAFALTGADPKLASRADLIAEQTLALLKQRRKRAARAYQPAADAARAFDEIALVLQVLLVDRERGFLSVAPPRQLGQGGWQLAPWPGGLAPVTDDRQPPSRAYRKLEEAFQWMGDEPTASELCVDLGGAPGGWSYTALKRGARVIAVDRSPLAPVVARHPRLTMIEGNAFTFEPPQPVDWLLSDVICEPPRALELIKRWVDRRACRKLVVTVKFKGQAGYGFLATMREALAEAKLDRFRIKHLLHNKNEVTVMARVA
ncbi:MAG TPA: SAM-dependent methyltransferase [Polyangia bacterium]